MWVSRLTGFSVVNNRWIKKHDSNELCASWGRRGFNDFAPPSGSSPLAGLVFVRFRVTLYWFHCSNRLATNLQCRNFQSELSGQISKEFLLQVVSSRPFGLSDQDWIYQVWYLEQWYRMFTGCSQNPRWVFGSEWFAGEPMRLSTATYIHVRKQCNVTVRIVC